MEMDKQLLVWPGCRKCPNCGNYTLPDIPEHSIANASCCGMCKTVVDKHGTIESTD